METPETFELTRVDERNDTCTPDTDKVYVPTILCNIAISLKS